MVPIGREFDSKDYERLEILDSFTQGRIDAMDAMRLLEIDSDALVEMVEKDGLPTQFSPGGDSPEALLPARGFKK